MDNQKIDILIPVFNEGKSAIKTISLLDQAIKTPHKIHICFDSFTDPTYEALKKSEFSNSLNFIKNPGSGPCEAIKAGFNETNGDCVIVYPADDLENHKIIDAMYASFLSGNDVVVASRFMKGGSMNGCPLIKSILVRLASSTLYLLSSIPVKDASNGFRLFSRKSLDTINIESTEGFTYSLEILVKVNRLGWSIGEVPSNWFERAEGKSNFKIFKWLDKYLKWYFYGLATSWLRRKVTHKCIKKTL